MSKTKLATQCERGKESAKARTLPLPGTRRLDEATQLALPLGDVAPLPSGAVGHGTRPPAAPRPGRTSDRGLRPPSSSQTRWHWDWAALVERGARSFTLAELNLRAWLGPGTVDGQADPEKRVLNLVGRVAELDARGLVTQIRRAELCEVPPPFCAAKREVNTHVDDAGGATQACEEGPTGAGVSGSRKPAGRKNGSGSRAAASTTTGEASRGNKRSVTSNRGGRA